MNTNHLVAPSLLAAPQAKSPSITLKPAPCLQVPETRNHEGQQLLTALFRSPGKIYQIGSLDRRNGPFKNTPVKNAYEALQLAKKFSESDIDAYFACAVYINADSRKASNAAGAYAYWMDIDCGEAKAASGKGYLTEADALVAVTKFCDDAGLPMPTHIVSSGSGLHIYWVLDSVTDRETWQTHAGKLKALTKALGFLADDSRTSDIASVLRIPGTLNFKYEPPKPVTLLQATDTFIQQSVMLAAIENAVRKLCPQPAKTLRAPSPKIRQATSSDDADRSNDGPLDIERIASALTTQEPDCEEIIWTLQRLAPLARAAVKYPALEAEIRALAISWSSGELRGKASKKWSTPGSNGKTGEEAFEGVWQRFLKDDYTGSQTTLGTIYHDAKEAGWTDTFKTGEQFEICETIVVEPVRTPIAVKVPSVKSFDIIAGDLLAGNELTIAPPLAPAATITKKPALSPLETIQQGYCLINMDGKVWVLDGGLLAARNGKGTAQKLVLSSRQDGYVLIHRAAAAQFPGVDTGTIFNAFLYSFKTICYDGVEFNPRGTTGNYLNLWVGPTITPKSGAWPLIRSFLLDVICDGNQASFVYLISYLAHALQRPGEKPGVMIILIGGQGTGKGTLGRILRKIWRATYLQISNIDNVVGNFNAALERAFIVFLDEALFVGNRRGSDALKSLVTEETIYINEKHQPARQVESFHRFIAATNSDHFKNTERDDRRDFALRVSDARKGDHGYWTALTHEMENGGVEAMAHDLLAMDLTGFNVRNKPETKELLAQKLQSLGPIARWWHDGLNGGFATEESYWPSFIGTRAAIDDIVQMAGGKLHQKPSAADVIREMHKLCPSAKQGQKDGDFGRTRGLSLPDIAQARVEFEKHIGGPVEWEQEEISEVAEQQTGPKSSQQKGL